MYLVLFIYIFCRLGKQMRWRDWSGRASTWWRQSGSVWDPAASPHLLLLLLPSSPPLLLWVRGDTRYQGGSRGASHLSHLFCAATVRSPRPVWWILFSALLSWVIWGIIPKVSKLQLFLFSLFSSRCLYGAYKRHPAVRRLLELLPYIVILCSNFPHLGALKVISRKCTKTVFFLMKSGKKVSICYITSRLVQSAK